MSRIELTVHDHFSFEDTGDRLLISHVFGNLDSHSSCNRKSARSALYPHEQVLREIEQKPYSPDSLAAWKRYLRPAAKTSQNSHNCADWLLAIGVFAFTLRDLFN